jgi:hypothetical protein
MDRGRGYPDTRLVPLVVGHGTSFACFPQHYILRYSPDCLEEASVLKKALFDRPWSQNGCEHYQNTVPEHTAKTEV